MDVRISKSYSLGDRNQDGVLELTGAAAEEISEERLRWLLAAAFPVEAMVNKMAGASFDQLNEAFRKSLECMAADKKARGGSTDQLKERMRRIQEKVAAAGGIRFDVGDAVDPGACAMRAARNTSISPAMLRQNIRAGQLDKLLQPFDEIDVPLDTGGTVTVVCGSVKPTTARFVLRDCWDEDVMNDKATNKTGYFKSKARQHVLENIYPRIAKEWRDIIVPRTIVEIIEDERVEYADTLWLPSATDVFGPSKEGCWKDEGENEQLVIFKRDRARVKEYGDNSAYPWWLRSVNSGSTYYFRYVDTGGSSSYCSAYYSLGFAPGFDI